MKIIISVLSALICLICVSCSQVSNRGGAVALEMREAIEWCETRHIDANKDDLPRVLLVGDSIVKGYANKVSELLREGAYCSWLATSRCLGDPVFEQELGLLLSQYHYKVIYFNNGLHGVDFPDQQYGTALDRVFKQLVNTKSVVVWRDITSINPSADDKAGQKQIDQRNEIAAKCAAKYNIQIDNLGTFDAESYRDRLHFRTDAIDAQAKHIANTIKNILK